MRSRRYGLLDVERVEITTEMSNNVIEHLVQLSKQRKYSELKYHFLNAAKALHGRPEWGALLKYILSASSTSKKFEVSDLNELTRFDMLSTRFEQWGSLLDAALQKIQDASNEELKEWLMKMLNDESVPELIG